MQLGAIERRLQVVGLSDEHRGAFGVRARTSGVSAIGPSGDFTVSVAVSLAVL